MLQIPPSIPHSPPFTSPGILQCRVRAKKALVPNTPTQHYPQCNPWDGYWAVVYKTVICLILRLGAMVVAYKGWVHVIAPFYSQKEWHFDLPTTIIQ